MRFVWLMLFFSAIALPGLADTPEPSEPYVTTSASRRCFLTLLPGRWDRGQFIQEPFGAAYKLQADGTFLELWRVEGWYSFHNCFLSDDGRYLVRVNDSPAGSKISKEDLAIAFYDRGKLLRQFSIADLVKDDSKVVASVSHYRWLAQPELGLPDESALDMFSFGDNKFGLTTADGIVYSFDITSGKIIATAKAPNLTAKGVAFEISKAGWADDRSLAKYLKTDGENGGAYLVGKPVSIRCVFRNSGSQPVTVWLKDHDPYSGTLPFPLDIQARIESGDGKVLTTNVINKEGWWTSIYLSSQIRSYEPGDNITIPPGENITRVVPLDEVLKGCDGLPNGLSPGNFIVQLRLFGPDLRVESNRLKITVAVAAE